MGKFKEYIELAKDEDKNLEKLLNVYRKDKYKARILFFNNFSKLESKRLGAFMKDDGSFEIAYFIRTWGISKTNKIYNRERKVCSIFKSENGFYFVKGKQVTPLTYQHLSSFNFYNSLIKFLIKHFPPLELMHQYGLLQYKTFNYILKHKLTSFKKMLQYEYNAPYPIAKKLISSNLFTLIKWHLANNTDYYYNIENFNFDLTPSDIHILNDTLNMAKTLNKKVNLGWSKKRLRLEHDKMSKIITEITLTELNEPLTIKKCFIEFAEFSGYELLKDTKSLALEGQAKSHCVGTYTNSVNSGRSGIYKAYGYTLELGIKDSIMQIKQLKGYRNSTPPKRVQAAIQKKLDKFNETNIIDDSAAMKYNEEIFW